MSTRAIVFTGGSTLALRRSRWLPGIEAASVFLLLMIYIWYFAHRMRWTWTIVLGIVVLSHVLRRESPRALGFRRANFGECVRLFAPPVLTLAAAMLAVGWAHQTLRTGNPLIVLGVFLGYCTWGLFQQYILNGYFVNRVRGCLGCADDDADARTAAVVAMVASLLFASVHAPNTFLMVVTLATGYVGALIYIRYRNLFFLGVAHALLGTMIWLVVPDTVSYHMKVGPGMLAHRDRLARQAPPSGGLEAMVREATKGVRRAAESVAPK
jgi:hypothetical protein